jgi:hypothetical protein
MLKSVSVRASLFLYVRTHSQLQYYLNLNDSRRAANQSGILASADSPNAGKIAEIHPLQFEGFSRKG